MNEPSDGVPPPLLPHIHLLSNFRYPIMAHLTVETIVDYLLQAPTITRHSATMNWTFIEAPPDGTIFLVWQPSQLGSHFASDGCIWADIEQAFSLEVKGCTLEMYIHKTGYHPGKENMATHARRRYRLAASKTPGINVPIDSSLWLVHYLACEPNFRTLASHIPVSPHIQQLLNVRRFLQSQGHLERKEFMLHDKNNWPTVNLPGGQTPNAFAPPGSFHPRQAVTSAGRGIQPNTFYGQQPQTQGVLGPSPSKRPRTTGSGQVQSALGAGHGTAIFPHDISLEEEEDTAQGDVLDKLTTREISTMRYKQHHEWMEEIFSSPYPIEQITPVDLGLGPLTQTLLQVGAKKELLDTTNVEGSENMRSSKMSEIQKRASDRVAELSAEIEKMRKQHEKWLERSSASIAIENAEMKLRVSTSGRESAGSEDLRTEAYIKGLDMQEGAEDGSSTQKQVEKVEDIVKEVGVLTKKKVIMGGPLKLVQKGGSEEAVIPSEEVNVVSDLPPEPTDGQIEDGDVNMSGYVSQVFDQAGISSASTPGANVNTPLGLLAEQSSTNTPGANITAPTEQTLHQAQDDTQSQSQLQT